MSSFNNTSSDPDGRARSNSMPAGLPGQDSGGSPQRLRSVSSAAIIMGRASEQEAGPLCTMISSIDDKPINDQPRGEQETPRPKPILVKNSADLPETMLSAKARLSVDADAIDSDELLRKWASGLPPKKSFLDPRDPGTPARFEVARRAASPDKDELDILLKATMVDFEDFKYLPITITNVNLLYPIWEETLPIANIEIFNGIMIDKEVNAIHADGVMEALGQIGEHCHRLLISAPVSTSELGDVFCREEGDVNTGNDWDHLLRCLPNLEQLVFIHSPAGLTGGSERALNFLRSAVERRQGDLVLEEVY